MTAESTWSEKVGAYVEASIAKGLLGESEAVSGLKTVLDVAAALGPCVGQPDVACEGDGEIALYWHEPGQLAEFRISPDGFSAIMNVSGDSKYFEGSDWENVAGRLAEALATRNLNKSGEAAPEDKAPRPVTVAIDYDGTLKRSSQLDPEECAMWGDIIRRFVLSGRRVVVVTARMGTMETRSEIGRYLAIAGVPETEVVCCNEVVSKDRFCCGLGIEVDIWIDDMPEQIRGGRP